MKQIIAVGGDAGGAAALAPVLQALQNDRSCHTRVLGYRQAVDVWSRSNIAVQRLPERPPVDPVACINGEDVNLLITSTSVNGVDHERRFLRWAAAALVPSVTVLDFWSNYAARFRDENDAKLILPSALAVIDERMKREMVAEGFPAERLFITGQPAFDSIHAFRTKWTESTRHAVRSRLGARAESYVVLFASQPLSQMADLVGSNTPRDDERELLETLVRSLDEIAESENVDILLAVRPHPRESLRPQEFPHSERIRLVLSADADPWSAALASDLVIGMTSVLLVEASLLGSVVVSLQPGGGRLDPLPPGIVPVYDLATLRGTLNECLLDDERRAALRTAKTDWMIESATVRILALIRTMLERETSKA